MIGKPFEWAYHPRSLPYLCTYRSEIEYVGTNLQGKSEEKITEFKYISFLELNMYTKTEAQAT